MLINYLHGSSFSKYLQFPQNYLILAENFLDEPTAGLDLKERIRIRNFISTIAINKIVLIATHVVSDIEFIAKEILLLKEGKLLVKEKPAAILETMEGKVYEVRVSEEELPEIQSYYRVSNISSDRNGIFVRLVNDSPPEIGEPQTVKPNLEDVYLSYFG